MTGRERFLTAMAHKQPDRIPMFDFLFMQDLFYEVIGIKPESYNAEDAVNCTLALGLDAVWIPSDGFAGYSPKMIGDNTYQDEWGTVYEKSASSWPIDAPLSYPIANWNDLKNWECPNPHDLHRTKSLKEGLKLADKRIAVLGGVLGPLSTLYALMGLEEGSIASIEDPKLFHTIMRIGTDYAKDAGLHLLETDADAIIISDDLGYNSGTFLSPESMRIMVLPYIREIVAAFKKTGTKVMLHCDGNMNGILEDLATSGIDAWQPLERKGNNNLAEVKKKYGHVLTPVGNVDSSTVLPYGTKEDVIKDTIHCMRQAGEGGGYIIGSDHSLHDGIPVSNIITMVETVHRYGTYPLDLPNE